MRVLVDTSIWSLALRRSGTDLSLKEALAVDQLKELIRDGRVIVIGPVRQEILSGIPDETQFRKLKAKLRAFEDLELTSDDYELAAEFTNACRKKGVQGSHIDFLICAVAVRNKLPIFTLDKDFERYAQPLGISLYRY
ncbi:PIN domain nuclease [bacterium]|nr:MAG: PIN domain nuclease [bacterium]